MGVEIVAAQGDEKFSGFDRARVGADAGDGDVRITRFQLGAGETNDL